jgi:hypothetical protein
VAQKLKGRQVTISGSSENAVAIISQPSKDEPASSDDQMSGIREEESLVPRKVWQRSLKKNPQMNQSRNQEKSISR